MELNMMTFTANDYGSIRDQILTEYLREIEEIETLSEIYFSSCYDFNGFKLFLNGTIEVEPICEVDANGPHFETRVKICLDTYELKDDDYNDVESDFNPKELMRWRLK